MRGNVLVTRRTTPRMAPGRDDSRTPGLNALEREVVEFFVRLSRLLGQPASFGQIYGLLFISPRPLPMDELVERLQISKGSASQGLRFLHTLGAVRRVQRPDDRRTHYEAAADLRRLAGRFPRGRVEPRRRDGETRLDRMTVLVETLPEDARRPARGRIRLLRSWSRNSRRVLPLILRVLGS